jgi:glutathione S-transferase
MIDLYYWTTPNGHKITLFLEESGLPYTIKPINIGKGDQFQPEFLKISPNNRIPAIVDHAPVDGGAAVSVFESGAIHLPAESRASSCQGVARPVDAAMGDGRWAGWGRWPAEPSLRNVRSGEAPTRSTAM